MKTERTEALATITKMQMLLEDIIKSDAEDEPFFRLLWELAVAVENPLDKLALALKINQNIPYF